MQIITSLISQIANVFKFHKKKIGFIILSCTISLFLLFPIDDLNDLVTEQVANATNRQVFLTFENLNLSFLPVPGFQLNDVKLDIQNLPTIEAGSLSLSPSISSLLRFKLGFVSRVQGLFDGNLQLVVKPGEKTDRSQKQVLNLDGQNIEIARMTKLLKSPITPRGKVLFELSTEIDPSFSEQPEAELSLKAAQIILPSSQIPTDFGDMPLPELNFTLLNVKGRLTDGDLIFEQMELGSAKDPLTLKVKGRMGLKLIGGPGGTLITQPGGFDLKLSIANKGIESKDLQLLLSFLDTYKTPSANGDLYLVRLRGENFRAPPQITKINTFD